VRIVGIIPACFASTCFSGKPPGLIAGNSLIQLVLEQGQVAKSLVFAAGDGICVGVDLLQNKYEL
jgi:CMP-2-keto-3-deoxyoctulosonic acid synthetase